ncbi:Uncharacterised protein [Segatella copri]|nr:Uncharacterised protein [Segatella copri]
MKHASRKGCLQHLWRTAHELYEGEKEINPRLQPARNISVERRDAEGSL